MKAGTKFLFAVLASTTLLLGCTATEEAAVRSDTSTTSASNSTSAETTSLKRNEVAIKAPDYDPHAVQPEDWPQLSEAQVRKAVNIGLAEPRLENFLKQNNFKVSEVRRTESIHYRAGTTDEAHLAARVVVVLDRPVPLEESGYKGDICDIGGATGPVTGFVWISDFVEESVEAFSPQWNYDVSCT